MGKIDSRWEDYRWSLARTCKEPPNSSSSSQTLKTCFIWISTLIQVMCAINLLYTYIQYIYCPNVFSRLYLFIYSLCCIDRSFLVFKGLIINKIATQLLFQMFLCRPNLQMWLAERLYGRMWLARIFLELNDYFTKHDFCYLS